MQYLRHQGTGTLHVDPECVFVRRHPDSFDVVEIDREPEDLWEQCWANRDLMLAGRPGVEVLPGDQGKYGREKWACLRCVEQAAIDAGWVNTHQPDPERNHR